MKIRTLTVLFLSLLLLSACKEPDFTDTTVKLIPKDTTIAETDSTETAQTQFVEDFHGYKVVYTLPYNTEVTDANGNTLLTFEGCDYRISGELLIITTAGEDTDYLIYRKDLSPITSDGKEAEFAHKFDDIAMCEDGGFAATAKHDGVLLRFAPDGSLKSTASFEKLFTVGIKPESGDPVAAVSDGDKFKFVTPEGETLCELPFAPHLNYLKSYYAERDGMKGLYFHVAFKGGATYYFCPETGDSGYAGIEFPDENLVYHNNYISAYRTENGVEVRQRLGGDIHLYEDVLIGEYYDPVFGTTETEAVFMKSNGTNIEFYTYNYGSARKGAENKIYSLIEDYILIGSTLYDYHLNDLVTITDTYGRSIKSFDGYSADPSTGYITINCTTQNDTAVTYTLYPTLPTAVPAEDAELVHKYTPYYGEDGTASIYRQSDGYVGEYPEIGLTLKLPVDGEFLRVFTDTRDTSFIYMKDGKLTASVFSRANISHAGIGSAPALFTLSTENPQYLDRFGDGGIIRLNYASYYVSDDGSRVQLLGEIADPAGEEDPRDYCHEIVGDYMLLSFGPSQFSTVFDTSFNQLVEGTVYDFCLLDDGRHIGKIFDDASGAFIVDTDGSVNRIDTNGGSVLKVGKSYIFMLDADDVYRLYSPDMELLCEFGEDSDGIYFHTMLSGIYKKEGQLGYYFVFEDRNDQDEHYNLRGFEYYYIPETGEHGILELGYSSFAYAKPVLYLYPEKETDITVTFEHPERLTTVYPTYGSGWNVTAQPDGTLTDDRGREYYCLYWEESSGKAFYDFLDGFCVSAKDSAAFLEEKLDILGFTEKEANEFIIYWLPILEQSEYNLIRFELTEEREASNALHISPSPDSLLRMAIHIKPLTKEVNVPEQTLPRFDRHGFAAVEWGGCVH